MFYSVNETFILSNTSGNMMVDIRLWLAMINISIFYTYFSIQKHHIFISNWSLEISEAPFINMDLILTWICEITSIIMCKMKLLIHSQNLTVQPLQFGNG